MPLSFEANRGQTDPHVKFTLRTRGAQVFLTQTGATFLIRDRDRAAAVRMTLDGARPDTRVLGEDEQPGRANYLSGGDPSKWITGVPMFAKVRYRNVYRGIDLVYHGDPEQLEYDFIVAPGADPKRIRLSFEGASAVRIDKAGNLILTATVGEIRQRKPVVYQDIDGKRIAIDGSFKLFNRPVAQSPDRQIVGFSVGAYDASAPLVIDPTISYSTYLGGSNLDSPAGIAIDASGNAYVTGRTDAALDFPITPGVVDTVMPFGSKAFVTKVNATGTAIVYSTYLGGGGFSHGTGIAVDATGNAYITGITLDGSFPVTSGVAQGTSGGGLDAFITKLNPTGTALVFSTYLGGAGNDQGNAVAIDGSENVYVTGLTTTGFPITVGAFQTTSNGGDDTFVAKVNATGASVTYATLLSGGNYEEPHGLVVDGAGHAYVVGQTASTNFPTTGGALQTALAGGVSFDAFVTKVNPAGSGLVYSTLLGGTSSETGNAIAVDGIGQAYITGFTGSPDFPTTGGALTTTFNGTIEAFVTKLNAAGAAMLVSTYLGGSGTDQGSGIGFDALGRIYVMGVTNSSNFPTTGDGFDPSANGNNDLFVTRLNAAGGAITYSTYLGGSFDEPMNTSFFLTPIIAPRMAIDTSGNTYHTGVTSSADFPTTAGVFDSGANGSFDGFVAKFRFAEPLTISSLLASPASIFPADRRMVRVTLAVTATDDNGLAPTCAIETVVANAGPFGTLPDFVVINPLVVDLRADRPSGGTNRKYTITVKCTDGDGASATQAVEVQVTGVR